MNHDIVKKLFIKSIANGNFEKAGEILATHTDIDEDHFCHIALMTRLAAFPDDRIAELESIFPKDKIDNILVHGQRGKSVIPFYEFLKEKMDDPCCVGEPSRKIFARAFSKAGSDLMLLIGHHVPREGAASIYALKIAEGFSTVSEQYTKDFKTCVQLVLEALAQADNIEAFAAISEAYPMGLNPNTFGNILIDTASKGNEDFLKYIIERHHASLSEVDVSKSFRWAANEGHTRICKMLLPFSDAGSMNCNALKFAITNRHTDTIEFCIDAIPLNQIKEALKFHMENGGEPRILDGFQKAISDKESKLLGLEKGAHSFHRTQV